MILSDKSIISKIKDGSLIIAPIENEQVQPASVDIRLGNTFCSMMQNDGEVLSLEKKADYNRTTADKFIIYPGQFILATTMEYIAMPNDLTAFVEGRSSIGRLGLFIQNAGWVDPGFKGEITLELFNASTHAIELKAGQRIGQLVFVQMDAIAMNPYNGKYQGQTGATGSRIYMDFTKGRKI